jgi:hypothetical protein
MLVKIILVFLLCMVLLGMIGRALFPDALSRRLRKSAGRPGVCKKCGRHIIGKTCDCTAKGKST